MKDVMSFNFTVDTDENIGTGVSPTSNRCAHCDCTSSKLYRLYKNREATNDGLCPTCTYDKLYGDEE